MTNAAPEATLADLRHVAGRAEADLLRLVDVMGRPAQTQGEDRGGGALIAAGLARGLARASEGKLRDFDVTGVAEAFGCASLAVLKPIEPRPIRMPMATEAATSAIVATTRIMRRPIASSATAGAVVQMKSLRSVSVTCTFPQ